MSTITFYCTPARSLARPTTSTISTNLSDERVIHLQFSDHFRLSIEGSVGSINLIYFNAEGGGFS
jgi:hypothetical protein